MNAKMSNRIKQDIVFHAVLENASPLIMGSEKGEDIDLEILKHSNGHPYISGTAFSGKLLKYFNAKEHFERRSEASDANIKKNQFFFLGEESGSQSHIRLSNLELEEDVFEIVLNDSNKITKQEGIVENKFNFEKLNPGCRFQMKGHITVRENFDLKYFIDALLFIRAVLDDDFRIGAKTAKGYGRMKLKYFHARVFDYQDPEAFTAWEHYLREGTFQDQCASFSPQWFCYRPSEKIHFQLQLAIQSQFITGEAAVDEEEVGKVQSQRNGTYILKGESFKNALSHRAYRILNTVCNGNHHWANDLMLYLFGEDVTEAKAHQLARLCVNESVFCEVRSEKQTRIKINRFTGGTVNGALAIAMPIHGTNTSEEPNLTVDFEFKGRSNEQQYSNAITLLLHLIKDLFTGDLPIGGEKATGKGVFKGCLASIQIGSEKVELQRNGYCKGNSAVLQSFNHFKIQENAAENQ